MEEVLPPQTESGAGFEPARVRQFTVFMENRVGRLQALVHRIEKEGIRIVALSVQNQADTALARLISSDAERCRELLVDERFSYAENDVLVVELPRRAKNPLTTICAALLAAELNIHYAYPLMVSPGGPAIALCADDPVLATQLCMRKGFRIIGESDLSEK